MYPPGPRLPLAGELGGSSIESSLAGESPDMIALREALGALPLGEPGMCRVFKRNGAWHVHRYGAAESAIFSTKDEALASARLSLVRCASYCLLLQQEDGRVARESLNWRPRRVG
jgi:hypothetical protein